MSKGQSFLTIIFLILLIGLGFIVGRNVFETALSNVAPTANTTDTIKQTTDLMTAVADDPDALASDLLSQFITHGAVPVEKNIGSLRKGRSNPFVPAAPF